MELVDRLQELVEQHATTEESSQFPALRAAVPREKLVEMRVKVDTAKKLAPTRPHPGAPNAELFHKLVGPGVGLVDRLRDKLSGRTARISGPIGTALAVRGQTPPPALIAVRS
jgi:hypothetical protein